MLIIGLLRAKIDLFLGHSKQNLQFISEASRKCLAPLLSGLTPPAARGPPHPRQLRRLVFQSQALKFQSQALKIPIPGFENSIPGFENSIGGVEKPAGGVCGARPPTGFPNAPVTHGAPRRQKPARGNARQAALPALRKEQLANAGPGLKKLLEGDR